MVCCWLLKAAAARDFSTADAISYLDIAHSCVAGHWHALVSGWWSPAFPFLLTICLKIFKPDPYHEALLVHLLAFVSLIAALASFEYFLAVFLKFRAETTIAESAEDGELIPERSLLIVGYALFFWITTFLVPPTLEQPDILVFILYLLASALCMQVVTNPRKLSRYAFLGLVLGLGYLTKSVMFPLGFVFYVALLFAEKPPENVAWTGAFRGNFRGSLCSICAGAFEEQGTIYFQRCWSHGLSPRYGSR